LSYAVIQIRYEGSSEFLLDARQAAEIAATKKQKQKAARRVRLFWLLFWRSKKVTSRRATPGNVIQSFNRAAEENSCSTPIPTFPSRGKEFVILSANSG
jgi:hypothetical protein